MPKNKLSDLTNHLFEQLERLNDEDLDPETLDKEIKRSKAMSGVAREIINCGELSLKAQKHMDEYGSDPANVVNGLIGSGKKEDSRHE